MSLILEALRRSEAERQIGRAPGLMTPVGMPPRRRRLAWLWVVPALVVVGVAGWWLGRGEFGLPTTPADATAPAIPLAAPPASGEPARIAEAETPQPTPVALPPPAVASAQPAPVQTPAAPVAAAPVVEPAPPAPTPPAPPPPAAEPLEVLPSIAIIPPQRRAELPPLRISMHVYAEAPAQRFVLIDGRRSVEGMTVQPGVIVDEIRRDGVVLEIDGTRVLLSRP